MRRQRDHGASLLEVIVAFGILSLSLSVLLPAFSGLTGSRVTAEDRWTATEIARSRLEEVGVIDPVRAEVLTGTAGDGWLWRIEMAPLQRPGLEIGTGLFDVVITVRARDGDEDLARLATVLPGGRVQ